MYSKLLLHILKRSTVHWCQVVREPSAGAQKFVQRDLEFHRIEECSGRPIINTQPKRNDRGKAKNRTVQADIIHGGQMGRSAEGISRGIVKGAGDGQVIRQS